MLKFEYIHHQLTLFDYEQLRPRTKIRIKRISADRMKEVMMERQMGNTRPLVEMLRTLNDDLERYCIKNGI
jgi:hypothetical protein